MSLRLIVCGGRDYTDRAHVFFVLDRIHRLRGIALIIHGAYRGADMLADEWANARGVPVDPHPAKWKLYGPKAGPIRNREMATVRPKPDGVVVFPGRDGTADMIAVAENNGIPAFYARK